MGFSEQIGDVVFAYVERWDTGTTHRGYVALAPDAMPAYLERRRGERWHDTTQSWQGDVVFDHQRGLRDVDSAPLCDPPYLLCWYTVDHEYTGQSGAGIEPKTDLAAALAEAQEMIAREKASGGYSTELTEVYVVRVREVAR